ncbi:hypothetical protein DSCW_22620 [Desulfosarcina widdelii]|uniref:Fis family transcriptional regulator n=1 Tax=Desulfosarcina widdelii TaxID=947919 RepID=A0A5K7Z2C5_9BACT|nr:sigma 54-interacting transcriptional regulator [Desulfosarcina widdelii]BBO74845.1 hypothetical protein DSCW_22620 [Desulfosarcina widdelii]
MKRNKNTDSTKILIVDDNPDIHRDCVNIPETWVESGVVDLLESRRQFEALVTEVFADFVNLPMDQIDAAIVDAQGRICDHLGIDRSVLWQLTEATSGQLRISHVYDVSGGYLPDDDFDAREVFPWVLGQILERKTVVIESLAGMPPEAQRDRESLMNWGVKSSYVIPLSAGQKVLGALSFGRLIQETTWSDIVVRRLHLVAQVFTSALNRKHAEEQVASLRRFERLITDISTIFVNLPVDQIAPQIEDAHRRICECLDVDLSGLWQPSDGEPDFFTVTHLYGPPETPLIGKGIDAREAFPWVLERVLRGELVMLPTEDMPPEAARDAESRRQLGARSSLAIPLSAGGGPTIGVLDFHCMHRECSWPEPIVARLQLIAQIFANALARKQAGEQLASFRRFEDLVADISAQFVNLRADQIDAEIEDAQRRICECLDVDLSSLWQWLDEKQESLVLTHLHSPPPPYGPVPPDRLNAHEAFPWRFAQLSRGSLVAINISDLPPEAKYDIASYRTYGIKSSVGVPLTAGGGPLIGILSFEDLKTERSWPDPILKKFRLISEIFANALARRQSETRVAHIRRFESLIAKISTQFVNLPADRIDDQIEDAQRQICDCLGVDLSSLWQWSEDSPHFMTITHLYSPPEGPAHPVGIDARKAFPWAFERLLRGEELVVFTESMPPEAARDVESRRHYGVQSSVNIPLSAGGGPLIGILTFDTLKAERTWQQPVLENLRLVAQIFANALTRKRSDLQLRESQMRLSAATESAGVGLWVMEADTGYVWGTPQLRALFQFDEDESLDYARFNSRIDPDDRERVENGVQAAMDSGKPLDIDFRVVLPDGGIRWIQASGRRMPGSHGQGVRMMGASRDVSHRKEAEKRILDQLEKINQLKRRLEKENIQLRKEIELQHVHEEIVSRSPVMKQVLSQAEQVARTEATVLIEGETGTGKELLARAVHGLSDRRDRPLVTVNCASLPATLVESELFGREKGAYTGALTRMTGRFEMADGATVFLDEVGELPLDVQAKLLRVLEQGRFERLGSSRSIQVDVRVIAATNKDLARQVDAGKFRKDLYYRLNVFPIHLPPLRERREDIPPLVWFFIRKYENKMGRRIDEMPRRCMDELQRYAWPGNIRELRNVIERALIVCSGRTLEVHPPNGTNGAAVPETLNLEELERRHIVDVLKQTRWRLSGPGGAAGLLGLKRTTLQSKMKKLGIRKSSA